MLFKGKIGFERRAPTLKGQTESGKLKDVDAHQLPHTLLLRSKKQLIKTLLNSKLGRTDLDLRGMGWGNGTGNKSISALDPLPGALLR